MKLTVYSTETCAYCAMLKHWLNSKNITYTEYQVDKNPYAAQMMVKESGQMGVPFSVIEHDDGTVDKILGFDQAKFTQALRS